MISILIWGIGEQYNKMRNLIRYFEETNQIRVIALVDKKPFMDKLDGYNVVEPVAIKSLTWDYIVVMAEKSFDVIIDEAINNYFIDRNKILTYKILMIPDITIDSYIKLKESNLTIVSNNCWGGMVYKTLGLRCISPFRNLFLFDDDYIKLIKDFNHYISIKPVFCCKEIDLHSRKEYPVLKIDDIKIHCNHDNDYQIAIDNWERRKIRINPDNIFFEMYTSDPNAANNFTDLIANKKGICFVDWESNNEKMIYLEKVNGLELWEMVNANAALSTYGLKYKLIELLLGIKEYRY